MQQLSELTPELQALVKKAATVLPAKINKNKCEDVDGIIQSEFPIDYPITDTGMTVLIVACSYTNNDKMI